MKSIFLNKHNVLVSQSKYFPKHCWTLQKQLRREILVSSEEQIQRCKWSGPGHIAENRRPLLKPRSFLLCFQHPSWYILMSPPLCMLRFYSDTAGVLEVRQGRRGMEQDPHLGLLRGNLDCYTYQTQQVLFGKFHTLSWHLRSSNVLGHCSSGEHSFVLLPKTQDQL